MSKRSEDPIWSHWNQVPGEHRAKKTRCRYCSTVVLPMHARPCRKHIISCSKAPADVKQYFRAALKGAISSPKGALAKAVLKRKRASLTKTNGESADKSADASESADGGESEDVAPHTEPLCILISDDENVENSRVTDSGLGTMPSTRISSSSTCDRPMSHPNSTVTASDLSDLFAKAMITGDVPLSWADNHFLKLFFHKLDPTFNLPSAEQLSDSVLERIHQQCESEILDKVHDCSNLSIVLSRFEVKTVGDKGPKAKMIVMLSSPENIWYKTLETYVAKDTPQVLQSFLEKTINNIGVLKISSIITNNPMATKVAIEKICKQWPHIIPLKCPYRALCKLFGDLCRLSTLHKLLVGAKSIFQQLGSSLKLSEVFSDMWLKSVEERGRSSVPLKENDSFHLHRADKWYFTQELLSKFLISKTVLISLATEYDSLFSDVNQKNVLDETFWMNVDRAFKFLEPLVEAIAALEKNTVVISELAEILCCLDDHFSETNVRKLFSRVEAEKAMACYTSRISGRFLTKYHQLANFLDPKYRGRAVNIDISEPSISSVIKTLEDYGNALGLFNTKAEMKEASNCLANFRRHDKLFGLPLMDCESGSTYWANLMSYRSYRVLATLATKLLAIPASSASISRGPLWSPSLATPDRHWLSQGKLNRLRMVKWALGKHIEEADLMLEEVDIDKDSPGPLRLEYIEERLKANVTILDVLTLQEPFSDAQLLEPGQRNSEDCVLVHKTFMT